MLQIKNVTITHKRDDRVLLSDASFVLNQGGKAVLIGEEGNGKSTLLKWIYDPALIEDYAETEGERITGGERLGYLPQELPREAADLSVYEYFAEQPLFFEKSPKDLSRLASQMNLPADFCYRETPMGVLSGGEKVKAQLMALLLNEPTVMLLDEPSNDLDLATLAWLEEMIAASPLAILYISHDETLIEKTANMVIHLEQVRRKTVSRLTVMRTSYREYVENREAVMANQTQLALTQQREAKIREEKFRRILQKVEHDQGAVSRQDPHSGRLLKKKMHAVKALEHRYEREGQEMAEIPDREEAMFVRFGDRCEPIPAGKILLDLSLDELRTPDDTRVLSKDIRLFLKGSPKLCIIGTNGCGKSTLLRQIAAQLIARDDIRAAYMPQNYADALPEDATPVEFLCETGDKEEVTRVRTYLGSMKVTADEMDHALSALSGGQRAKILLLKLSLSGANVLILDEPTRNFSPLSGPVIRRMLREYPGAILSISHDRKFIREVCDDVYELNEAGLSRVRY